MLKYLFYISQNYSFAILRPIQAKIIAEGGEIYWFFDGKEVNHAYLTSDEKCLNSVESIKAYNPDVVLVPGNLVPSFIPGLKVCIFHGFRAGKLNHKGQEGHFRIRRCFDLYCTQGPNTTHRFDLLQKKHQFFNVIETGWSAVDPLFTEQPSVSKEKPTVMMCSTFSSRLSCAPILYEKVSELSRTGRWNWIIQFHPKMPREIVNKYKALQSEHVLFVETDNVIPLLKQADVMLCDTSSILLMFLLQHKPVVTFRNIDPQPHLMNIEDVELLEETLALALTRPEETLDSIKLFINEMHPYTDGQSSTRILRAVDEVLAGKHPLPKSKPFNLLRTLKHRKQLGYWMK